METIKTLLQPSAFLFAISQSLEKEDMNKLYISVINDDYKQVIAVINELQEKYTSEELSEPKQLLLPIFLSQFRNSIIRDIKLIDELKHHKENMDFTYILRAITSVLDKYNITESTTIAKEVYEELFIKNVARAKKDKVYNRDSDDYLRDLQLKNKYEKGVKNS